MDEKIFSKFKQVLAQSLMLDHAELDFGIYRIMNQKREQILRFLNNDLHQLVEQTLNEFAGMDTADLKKQLAEKEAAIRQLGIDPSDAKPVQELRERLSQANDTEEMEGHVYDHLARFLARYYDNGDFMPIRRYRSGDTYAIPYDGEEVKLYWANADQYYIKTAEYFRHYAFNTPDGKRVEFTLREATTEQNNNKEEKGKERRFRLAEENPVVMQGDTLHIYFTYEPMPEATKQKALVAEAFERLTSCLPSEYSCLLAPYKDGDARSLLKKHLTDYVAKNSFDYFIHKDLRGFLKRELDFYVKNEMLVIDDIDSRDESQFRGVLAEVKAVKVIGGKIIDFLAQIENFQKRLWLKRKFVTQADYCITLDRIPRELYPEICANDRQREEWVRLFAIDEIRGDLLSAGYSEPLTEAFLEANPYLVLDTALFPTDFKHRLLSAIPHIDEQCNGLLINSENFQALRLMEEKYREKVQCVYIDPPYNTGDDRFPYKDGYQHSSWISMMIDRLHKLPTIISNSGVLFASIDYHEQEYLKIICKQVFGDDGYVTDFIWEKKNKPSFLKSNVGIKIDFVECFARDQIALGPLSIDKTEVGKKYPLNNAGNGIRTIEFPPQSVLFKIEDGIVTAQDMSEGKIITRLLGNVIIENGYNKNSFKLEGEWRYSQEKIDEIIANKEELVISKIPFRPNHIKSGGEDKKMHNLLTKSLYNVATNEDADAEQTNIFGKILFQHAKPSELIRLFVSASTYNFSDSYILDFFAGSGTTAHAVINQNRSDNGCRKYILVDMGSCIDDTAKPRVMKAVYSKDWNNGKPVSRKGISHCFKYLRLEQYEDTLNNLELPKETDDEGLFAGQFRTDYTLGYMLDTETEDSLLNMQWFDHPFDVKMKITQGTETTEQTVDMVETFNYLIGLEVDTMEWPEEGLCIVQGSMRQGGRTAVVWRDMDKFTDDSLKTLLTGRKWDAKRIFLNGDTAVIAALRNSLAAKVMNTEEEFQQRMFDEKD